MFTALTATKYQVFRKEKCDDIGCLLQFA